MVKTRSHPPLWKTTETQPKGDRLLTDAVDLLNAIKTLLMRRYAKFGISSANQSNSAKHKLTVYEKYAGSDRQRFSCVNIGYMKD
jgi:hypothetical protein